MKKLAGKISKIWDDFFFRPTSPATLGVFRIAIGIVAFLSVLGKFPARNIFYSGEGIVSKLTMNKFFPFGNYFGFIPDSDPWLAVFFVGLLGVIVSLIVGFKTKVSSILVFVGMMALSNRNYFVDNSGDDLMRINFFWLMFANSGAAYSIDKWLKVKKGLETKALKPQAPWALRLLQLQLAYLYFDTWQLKLPGAGWQDGTAMYYALNYIELRRFDMKVFFYYLWQIKLMTYMVLVGEFTLAFLIWFKRLRYYVVAIGVSLHIGINLTMQFPVFQYVMIASLLTFVYPHDMERAVSMAKSFFEKKKAALVQAHSKKAA